MGFAKHITSDPPLDTNPKQILMAVALFEQQGVRMVAPSTWEPLEIPFNRKEPCDRLA